MTQKQNLIHQSATSAAKVKITQVTNQKRKSRKNRFSRVVAAAVAVLASILFLLENEKSYELIPETANLAPLGESEVVSSSLTDDTASPLALNLLSELPVKGRAPKTGYARTEFYTSWPTIDGCSLRQRILKRDLGDTAVVSLDDNCTVLSGAFTEPYTGSYMEFKERSDLTSGLQIDHVVALSDAWQKGAQNLSKAERYNLATDPLNLLAVDSKTNQSKSDGDAATWLPQNKLFRCPYVARQISVKYKYSLWVSAAEKEAMMDVLESCPNEPAPGLNDN